MIVVHAAEEVTALDITTLVLAIIGALTGVAALAWAIASHVLTGARVKVELLIGWVAAGGVVTLPWSQFDPREPPPVNGIDLDYPVVGVQVRNKGRLPCTVQGWSISLDSGVALSGVQLHVNPPIPHRLDLGDEATWFAELHSVFAMIEASRGASMPSKLLFGACGSAMAARSRPRNTPCRSRAARQRPIPADGGAPLLVRVILTRVVVVVAGGAFSIRAGTAGSATR